MFSVYKQERDDQGREVIEMGLNVKYVRTAILAVQVVFIVTIFVMSASLMITGIALAFLAVMFVVAAFPVLGMIANASQLQIVLDGKAGKIQVASRSVQSELRMAELAGAEFGSRVSTSGDNNTKTTVYRLEFIKKNGERVPATDSYSSAYSASHRQSMLAAIKTALGRHLL